MKNLTRPLKLLIWAVVGCLIGLSVSLLLNSKLVGDIGGKLCFYAGIAVVVLGLLAGLKGNPRNNISGLGDKGYYSAHVVAEEERITKAMEKHYRENHILHANSFSFCLIPTGIVMAVMAHLSLAGVIKL